MCCVHGRRDIVCLRLMTFQQSHALQTRIELIYLAASKRPPNNLLILYWQFTKKNQSHLIILATNHMTHQNHWKPLDATTPSVSRIRPSDAQTSELTESSWAPVGWQPTISHPPWITVSTSKLQNITLPPNAKHATHSIQVNCPYIRIFIELHNQFYTVWFGHETRTIQYWLALMRVSFLNLILF